MTNKETTLQEHVTQVMVEELMLDQPASGIDPQTPLFGPDGLGLDSVDALQLVVAIEKHFGLKIGNSDEARGILKNVDSICEAIRNQPQAAE